MMNYHNSPSLCKSPTAWSWGFAFLAGLIRFSSSLLFLQYIGQLLANAPASASGLRTCEEVCEWKKIASVEIGEGFSMGGYITHVVLFGEGLAAISNVNLLPNIVLGQSVCILNIRMLKVFLKRYPRHMNVKQRGRGRSRRTKDMNMSVGYDKYTVIQYSVSSLLGYIEAGDIAIPEIQRPFVWKATQVRDKIDSLYNSYPTGYLIIWQNFLRGPFAIIKTYLIENGFNDKRWYNQVANYAYLDANINRIILKKAPIEYFSEALKQCDTGIPVIGSIVDKNTFYKNLTANCVPHSVVQMTATDYPDFLAERRKLMAKKILVTVMRLYVLVCKEVSPQPEVGDFCCMACPESTYLLAGESPATGGAKPPCS